MRFNTRLLHGETIIPNAHRETLPPVSQVSAFSYDSMEELEQVFQHKRLGFAYTRIGNPTVSALERKINKLEGGIGAVCCSSGMAAISAAILAICESGDEIVAGTGLYGGTINLLHDLEKLGIHTVFLNRLSGKELENAINEKTRLVFGEVISNPAQQVLDIPEASRIAHEAGVPLFVDSTTATPYIIRPLELGADVVIHSASKYINGGGNAIGGVIVDGGKFLWDIAKHKVLSAFRKYGNGALLVRLRTDIWENMGGCIAPMNAYLCYIGLDTLGLRMERICDNADRLAKALNELPGIDVNYLKLPQHPYHEYVDKELNGYGGGILNFRAGSRERAFRMINSLKCAMIASNIGDIRTLVIHPASTLYLHADQAEREAAGVYDDTVRVSVGIEDAEDLINDFTEAVLSAGHGAD